MIPSSDVAGLIASGKVSKAIFGSLFLLFYLKDPKQHHGHSYLLANRTMLKSDELLQSLKRTNTKYSSLLVNESQIGWSIVLVIYCYFCYKLVIGMTQQNGFKGKQKKDLRQDEKRFADVGGCLKAKEALLEIIEYIRKPEVYREIGVRMPKGVLLYGPPGTGKTLIAKAAAAEANIPVIFSSGSEFVEVFAGLGAKRVRDLFKQARALSPCMIFIDEIDAVGFHRGSASVMGGHRESETTLNQLLNEMDGFQENDQIIVVAATNLATSLDPALLRPGRFDHKIEVTLPSVEERRDIIKIHLRNKPHSASDEELLKLAKIMEGASGADLENLINLATLSAVRKRGTQQKISMTGDDLIQFALGQKQTQTQQAQKNAFMETAAQMMMFGNRPKVNK
ncbi:hypothetical protein FGO68_gene10618 [Halteria grandinella]|uniref:AAA+ ATPase domain-containing protein n=1 Tax=Halteria grandinella TaxID=5974 RepID=A0A8J8NWZ2_HALGN|nr:hypothetical protein FGO68_gene10618 [Halteria grandinella]